MLESPSTTESDPRQGWTLASRFSAAAAASPEATAVRSEAGDLRYAELDAAADALAARLHGRGVRRGDRVGVLLERSPRLIVALLGILKAGAAYVAVDPGDPVARLRTVLGDAEVALVVTEDPQRAGVEGEFPSLDIQDARDTGACAPTVEQTPEDLAYVAYTSGSTGRPKGVCVPHRAVLRLVLDAAFLGARTDDVFLQLAPVAFDASTLEIWGALLNGGCLALAPAGRLGPAEIVKTVRDTGTTVLFLTTALFHQAVEAGLSDLPALRALYTGGEVLSAELVDRAAAALPAPCCRRPTAPPRTPPSPAPTPSANRSASAACRSADRSTAPAWSSSTSGWTRCPTAPWAGSSSTAPASPTATSDCPA